MNEGKGEEILAQPRILIARTKKMSEHFIHLDVKWISVFQNGDMYTPPVKFVVYRKHLRNFDVFLNSLTQRLKPRFGAIRNLYTPVHGHKINSLDDLEPNQNYVAAGTEKFRNVRYGGIHIVTHPTRTSHYRPYSLVEIQPVVHSAIKVASRYKTAIKNSAALTIFVYRNGDDISPPKVVPLIKKDLRNWDVVLKRVSEKILPFGTCHLRRLCSLNGNLISRMTELSNGEYYVAVVGRENFKSVTYGMLNPPVSRKFTNWSLADFASPIRCIKNSNNFSLISNKLRRKLYGKNSIRTQSIVLNGKETRRLFNSQTSTSANTKTRHEDSDEDRSGIYQAKMRKDVQMANESKITAMILPLDTQEIDDEEIIPLTRKTAREFSTNMSDENSGSVDTQHPSAQLCVDEKDQLCYSPQEQRDAWCNEMRKLKDKILSKMHNSNTDDETSTKIDFGADVVSISPENTSRQHSLNCDTHRLPKSSEDQWVDEPKKNKSKLRKPRIFSNKSTSSCASDATTYTVDSSSSSDIPRNKSSTEETTDSSKLAVVRTNRHTIHNISLPSELSPQSNDPCCGESVTTDSYMNDSFISDMSSYRDLFNRTYTFEKDSLEDILLQNIPSSEKNVELPSTKNDFPILNSFQPFVSVSDRQSGNKNRNSYLNGISHINIEFESGYYSTGAEDGCQLKYFPEEMNFDSLNY